MVDELKDEINRIPITEVVEALGGLGLRSYGNSLQGNCPTGHKSGKQRAFSVNIAGNYWNCFKCKTGGGVISLVELVSKVDFLDAARWLGENFRPELLPQIETGGGDLLSSRKIEELKTIASKWFHELLLSDAMAENCRVWLGERGIPREFLDCPVMQLVGLYPGSDRVLKHFQELDYTAKEIDAAGLLPSKQNNEPQIVFTYHLKPSKISRFKTRKIYGRR